MYLEWKEVKLKYRQETMAEMCNHTVNALLLNFCKFDQTKSRENANCTVMISKLYCNGHYSTVLKSLQYSL